MITQKLTYNKDYSIISLTETNFDGEVSYIEKYDDIGRIIYRNDGKGNYEEYVYTGEKPKINDEAYKTIFGKHFYSVVVYRFGAPLPKLSNYMVWIEDVLFIAYY